MNIDVRNVDYSKIVSTEISKVELVLDDVPVSLTNAIRRIILSEIPNVAFYEKDIKIIENKSELHNEFIAHRTSLLPIYRDRQFKIVSKIILTILQLEHTIEIFSQINFEYFKKILKFLIKKRVMKEK